ncbi:MAG: nucleoside deaminase [Verrucomicrobiota bacterium]
MDRDPFMQIAIDEAKQGLAEGGIPIGACLEYNGKVIGRGRNLRVQADDPILHGEMAALQNAGRQHPSVYAASTLYTTLSPCPMCSGAALLFKIPRVVIGENVNFMGEEELLRSRGVKVDVLQDQELIDMMGAFIKEYPEIWNEDIAV